MGFFSQDCEACGHPLLSSSATDPINRWMIDSVAILPDGIVITGDYDGYGTIMGDCTHPIELDEDGDEVPCSCETDERPTFVWESGVTTWHAACWKIAGSPTDNRGDSRHSDDQGWFFDDDDHAVAEPKTFEDVVAARLKSDAVLRARYAGDADENAALAALIADQAKLPGLQQ